MTQPNAPALVQAPPAAQTVFCRAHGLGALIQRWEFEQTIQGFDELSIVEIHKGMVADLGRWIETEGLRPYLTESESALLAAPLGHWTEDLVESVGWRLEPLGVLAWALGLIKALPPYDRRCSHDELLMRLRLGKSLRPQREAARLLPMAQLQAASKAAQLWEWRAQTEDILRRPEQLPGAADLVAFIASQARAARQRALIPEPIDGDFPALGRSYRGLSDEQRLLLAAIAKARAETFRWLCGPADSAGPAV
ncbi:MAG: DUF4272 domain-containing protein [Nitrospirota bacterium]